MVKALLYILLTANLYGYSFEYNPYTRIKNYEINITIGTSGELHIVEQMDVLPRRIHPRDKVDDPILRLEIPTMFKSKHSIRYTDSEPYDFSVLLNNKLVSYEKKVFNENEPSKTIVLRLSPNYMMDFLTEDEKKDIKNTKGKYVYTLGYKIKKTVTEGNTKDLESIEWKNLIFLSDIVIKKVKINIFFPLELTKEDLKVFDLHYTAANQKKQEYQWKDNRHFYASIDNLKSNDFTFQVSFLPNLLKQSSKDNFNLISNQTSFNTWDDFLLYWPVPFFLLYFMFLYYYARSYGSFATIGVIPVRYKPVNDMSVLQSSLIFNKMTDKIDLPAAIVELASLGYLKIIDKGFGQSTYLKLIKKNTDSLSKDQHYLLKKILFSDHDIYYLQRDKNDLPHKLNILRSKLHSWIFEKGYIYDNVGKTRKLFLIKALVTSIPVLIFSLYTTKEFYGERLMIGSIAGVYFLIGIIVVILMKGGFLRAMPFLFVLYIIIGIPFVLTGASYLTLFTNPMILLPFLYAFIWFFYKKIGAYTGKGLQAYRHLLGYKEFLERTEVPKLKYMLKDHPKEVKKSLAYAILFKMISYPSLLSYEEEGSKSSSPIDNYTPYTSNWGGVKVISNISKEILIFWFVGIILFFALGTIGSS